MAKYLPIMSTMSEMLGNQYFLSRNYQLAATVYSKVHEEHPENLSVTKRMIICLTQTGEINRAFNLFYELVNEEIRVITETDPVADDCPCGELTEKYGKILPYENNSTDLKLLLGILWLYCDAKKSMEFFEQLSKENPSEGRYKEIVYTIRKHLNNKI